MGLAQAGILYSTVGQTGPASLLAASLRQVALCLNRRAHCRHIDAIQRCWDTLGTIMPKVLVGSYSTPISSIKFVPSGYMVPFGSLTQSSYQCWLLECSQSGLICLLQPLNLLGQWSELHQHRPAQGWALTFSPNPRISHAPARTVREAGNPPLGL